MNKSEAGFLGGLARAARHTFEELSSYGKKGGRPRLLTYDELVKSGMLPSADSILRPARAKVSGTVSHKKRKRKKSDSVIQK
jgi:hypothetical protein